MKFVNVITIRKKIPITMKKSNTRANFSSLAKGSKMVGKRVATISSEKTISQAIRVYVSK